MVASEPFPAGEFVPTADQRIVMLNVPWSHFEALLALRGDVSVPRMSYLDGAMELMSPSRHHERIKSNIGVLVQAYALERGIDFGLYGAWTLKEGPKRAGIEPDECFIFGSDQSRERPDLAIEVIWSSGGIDKLEAYRRLGIREVWLWKAGTIQVHIMAGDDYELSARSAVLPDLDLNLLTSFLDHPSTAQAVIAFRAALTGK